MGEGCNISPGHTTQCASAVDDLERKFHRTIRHGTKIQICRALLQDFFADCSIQGFKYFCERKRHWSERVFWMIMFVIATCLSGYYIHKAYTKWDDTPVIVNLSEKATPVWKVPFPAVTICPEAKISAKELNLTQTIHEMLHSWKPSENSSDSDFLDTVRNISENYFENITKQKMNHLIALAHICDAELYYIFNIGKNTTDADLIQELKQMSIKMKDSLDGCRFRDKNKNCSSVFRPILTEDGFCFTFNSLNSQDIYSGEVASELLSVTGQPNATFWDLEDGYNDTEISKRTSEAYPRRIFGTGAQNGLSLMLSLNQEDLDYFCQGPVEGFKVMLHSPAEIPLPSKNFFRVPLEHQIVVSVKPVVLKTSPELQGYKPNRKLCYMNSENPLELFKVYTQRHCELECISNFMAKECGCVYFSYPRNQSTPICGVKMLQCVTEIEEKMVLKIFLDSLRNIDRDDGHCNCLPSCNSINYDIETSSVKFDSVKFTRNFDVPIFHHYFPNEIESNSTKGGLTIYFKDKQFITSQRSERYGKVEFLAAAGGIVSLFIGVTALSFVEIFYYLTLRLVWTLRIYRYGKSKDGPHDPAPISTIKSA